MKKLLLLPLLFASQAEVWGFGHGHGASGPDLCLARIDDQQIVRVRLFSGHRLQIEEITVNKKNEKGELVPHAVKFGSRTLEEIVVTLPLTAVKGYDTEGKPIDRKRLLELLGKEARVIVIVGEPKVGQLTPFKNDIPVLSIPVPLSGGYYGYSGSGPVGVPPVVKPIDQPKVKD